MQVTLKGEGQAGCAQMRYDAGRSSEDGLTADAQKEPGRTPAAIAGAAVGRRQGKIIENKIEDAKGGYAAALATCAGLPRPSPTC